jgi:hypothetical protein
MASMVARRRETGTSPRLNYEGRVYVAPVGEGVTLWDLENQPTLDEAIEDAVASRYGTVSGWSGRARIHVEVLDEVEDLF